MKVLLLSQRRIANLVAYCLAYEFEDTFMAVTGAERIDATDPPALEYSRRAYKLARFASGSPRLARQLVPSPRCKTVLDRDFDLFFPVFSHAYELYSLAMIPNWRQRCRKAACFITEIGSETMPNYLIELLSSFDHVFLGDSHRVQEVARIAGVPCTYLPLAVDVLRFAPPSPDQPRPIDCCYIGRRSSVTHKALLEYSEQQGNFYYYDTVAASGSTLKERTFRVENAREHRQMLAMLLRHSRYFFANRGHVNKPELATQPDVISARFYEGAASGTVMVGETPRADEFKRQFDWPDAVIEVPFDSPDIGQILADLSRNSDRLRTAARHNTREAARRHDWLHRIRAVFDTLDLKPTEAMRARALQLDQIALR